MKTAHRKTGGGWGVGGVREKSSFPLLGKQTAYIAFSLCQQFHCTLVIKEHYMCVANNSKVFQNYLSKIITLGFP